jgi:hypothetical protein
VSDDNVEVPADAGVEAPPEQPNAVLVLRTVKDNGDIECDAVPLGDVKVTEVQTVLELGLASFRAKVGLR